MKSDTIWESMTIDFISWDGISRSLVLARVAEQAGTGPPRSTDPPPALIIQVSDTPRSLLFIGVVMFGRFGVVGCVFGVRAGCRCGFLGFGAGFWVVGGG